MELANYSHFKTVIDNYFTATNSALMVPQPVRDLLKSKICLSENLIYFKLVVESYYLQVRCCSDHWCSWMPGYRSNGCNLVVVFEEAIVCFFEFDFQR